jgi:hypothetical protein
MGFDEATKLPEVEGHWVLRDPYNSLGKEFKSDYDYKVVPDRRYQERVKDNWTPLRNVVEDRDNQRFRVGILMEKKR